jgi:hypothetical protein
VVGDLCKNVKSVLFRQSLGLAGQHNVFHDRIIVRCRMLITELYGKASWVAGGDWHRTHTELTQHQQLQRPQHPQRAYAPVKQPLASIGTCQHKLYLGECFSVGWQE